MNGMEDVETRKPDAPAAPSQSVLALPFAFTALLAAFATLSRVRENQHLLRAFCGVALALLVWNGALFFSAAKRKRALSARLVIRRPHWLQPLVQLSIYIYWSTRWPVVASSAYLIVAQIVFAYAFDMLLAWTLGDEYELGFGPFPVILSINLFLWFKPDWFAWQFALVALGFGAKRLIRWNKDGHRAHIFNPSSFPLAIFSLVLILTGTTDHTWGIDIAKTIADPPHIYEYIFLVSIPGQILFGVASMTMPAVVAAYLWSALYFAITGTYFFFGTIPLAAFLGMLLLFTDPSTAPKSELGRIIYGVLYGTSVFVLYGLLDLAGLPLFYDKLLFVPVLNVGVRAIDQLAARPALAWLNTARLAPKLTARKRNTALMAIWSASFIALLALHGVGDVHPANRLPFWAKACAQDLRNACRNLETMERTLCDRGAGWACNELGIRILQPGRSATVNDGIARFDQACKLGTESGCVNAQVAALGPSALRHQAPRPQDYQFLIDNRTLPTSRTGMQELHWACAQGWDSACADLQRYAAPPNDRIQTLESACAAGEQDACRTLGELYRSGQGVPRNEQRALACSLGLSEGCVSEAKAATPR